MDRIILLTLKAEIVKELENLERLSDELGAIKSKNTPVYLRSKGSILHDFYNCCERIFKKVAFEMNGSLDESDRWHKALLYKMTINIDGIRPALISNSLAGQLHDYLSFRYLFRNIYGFELKKDKIDFLIKKHRQVTNDFIIELKEFLLFLDNQIQKEG